MTKRLYLYHIQVVFQVVKNNFFRLFSDHVRGWPFEGIWFRLFQLSGGSNTCGNRDEWPDISDETSLRSTG